MKMGGELAGAVGELFASNKVTTVNIEIKK